MLVYECTCMYMYIYCIVYPHYCLYTYIVHVHYISTYTVFITKPCFLYVHVYVCTCTFIALYIHYCLYMYITYELITKPCILIFS